MRLSLARQESPASAGVFRIESGGLPFEWGIMFSSVLLRLKALAMKGLRTVACAAKRPPVTMNLPGAEVAVTGVLNKERGGFQLL